MSLPTFYVAGFPKCGTTTVYEALARHPDVLVSENKEPHFFDVHHDRGLEAYREEHFAHASGEPAVGEATPNYLFVPYALDRILDATPEARFVVCLRDPVERAYSEWWMYRTRGTEHRAFPEAAEAALESAREGFFSGARDPERRWIDHYRATIEGPIREAPYVEVGHYAEALDRLRERVPDDRIHLLRLDELRRNPRARLADVLDFLDGPDPRPTPEPGAENTRLGPMARPVALAARKLGVKPLLDRLPDPVRAPLKRAVAGWGDRPAMDEAVRERLARHFEPWNERLARDHDVATEAWTGGPAEPDRSEVSA